jgi:hypothetical protein
MFEPEDVAVRILFDAGSIMRQQYVAMKVPYAEEVFSDWFEKGVLKRTVNIVDLRGLKNLFAELISLGIPKKEHVYFRVAVHGQATLLVSLDSDFFDPSKKRAGEKEKKVLLKAANGPVCKHMRKAYGIPVRCPDIFAK